VNSKKKKKDQISVYALSVDLGIGIRNGIKNAQGSCICSLDERRAESGSDKITYGKTIYDHDYCHQRHQNGSVALEDSGLPCYDDRACRHAHFGKPGVGMSLPRAFVAVL
jgi:hypothetical protein